MAVLETEARCRGVEEVPVGGYGGGGAAMQARVFGLGGVQMGLTCT